MISPPRFNQVHHRGFRRPFRPFSEWAEPCPIAVLTGNYSNTISASAMPLGLRSATRDPRNITGGWSA